MVQLESTTVPTMASTSCGIISRLLLSFFFFVITVYGSAISPRITADRPREPNPRERTKLSTGWRFWRSETIPDNIIYDLRPDANSTDLTVLKPWILPCANPFVRDPEEHHNRPTKDPDIHVPYISPDYDDSDWDEVRVPHDWAIAGPFYTEEEPPIGHDMGLLPVQGVGLYRRTFEVNAKDLKKSLSLDIDGAMSYPMVWLNGHLVGGWAYGYDSFRLDLTPYVHKGSDNLLAIRVENPSWRILTVVPWRRSVSQRLAYQGRQGARRSLGNSCRY